MDTKSYYVNSPINSLNYVAVGWSWNLSQIPYLYWGGDNTDSGAECVMFNIESMIDLEDKMPNIMKMNLCANWFGSLSRGHVTVECTAYKGGGLVHGDGYCWYENKPNDKYKVWNNQVNTTGTLLTLDKPTLNITSDDNYSTALGAWALFGNRRSSVLGGAGGGMLGDGSTNINVLGATAGSGSGALLLFKHGKNLVKIL